MTTRDITYHFILDKGREEFFDIAIDENSMELLNDVPDVLPAWTELTFHQCPHCPLGPEKYSHCPVAIHLIRIVHCFDGLLSHDPVEVRIVTKERNIHQNTIVQQAIGSMMGLIISTCGCPHTRYFRPMARFHLPLATEEETIFRSTSMYCLAQYFRGGEGKSVDTDFRGLTEIYRNVQIVNSVIAERLRAATETDSSINAVIFLDMYAKAMPYVIKDALKEIRYLFAPYLDFNLTKHSKEKASH